MGAIYRAICKTNGKVYVGQTTSPSWEKGYRTRWCSALGRASRGKNTTLWERAMNKYGSAGFNFRDLMANVDEEDLDGLERFFIRHFRSDDPRCGYNIQSGGAKRKQLAESTKEKLRSIHGARHLSCWYHGKYGQCISSTRGLAKRHGLEFSSLLKVKSGAHTSSCGWVCLDAPLRATGRHGAMAVWQHPVYGVVIGSTRMLVDFFPAQELRICGLGAVRLGLKHHHKGWLYVGQPTQQQEREARIQLANLQSGVPAVV